MNTVGKIFVMLIFVMSLMFMSFVMAVYMTHTNWKDKVKDPSSGLEKQLTDARSQNQALTTELEAMKQRFDAELTLKQAALASAETARDELKRANDAMTQDVQNLRTLQSNSVAAMDASQKRQDAQAQELLVNRDELRKARVDRDETFNQVVQLTGEQHDLSLQLESLQARQGSLGAAYAAAKTVLDNNDLPLTPELDSDIPPRVEGVVLAVRPDGLIEISIGSDDGLRKGHKLQVYRTGDDQSVYLGKVEVTETAPDKVVCKILPEFRKGTIQRGDRVASRLE